MEAVKIYKFRIMLWQDLSVAKKELKLPVYLGYKTASQSIYTLMKTMMYT